MMANEATSDILATSTTPDHELNKVETPIQDVTSEQSQPIVNGISEKDGDKQDTTEPAEANVNSAEVSVSGGSDTEGAKAEASKIGDEKGHVRSASTVKKSFKTVSINNKFLASKSATVATPSKLGDKGPATSTTSQAGPSTSTAPRPRLVAKSGSGLRDSAPRNAAAANGGKSGSAPDASAVWNKNRPAPPPEPKRFTDEELKQQYGIHLATRLQSDDPGKQANWADIDDDDDDWAPETIEWTDGTKITLPQVDETPAAAPEPAPTMKEAKSAELPKPISPASTQASASPTVKTSGLGTGRAGLILTKGASEKPTLVAKPPGPPTPVKSPWAPLPPVDKVAPIAIEIPQQQQPQQSRFSQRDPHGFQGMPPPPAKEIAADDFSRSSWREGSNTSRELYNSQSGRYEPVNEGRRGSARNDARGHQPAVLQRPSAQDGPAEPSAAFQTHRASGHEGGYGRRRTSSNVSGGSGNFVRRMSRGHDMPPPHEMLNVRRGSLAAVSDSPSSPRNFSPSGQHQSQRGYQNHQWQQSRASPVISHPSPQSTHGQIVPPASADAQSPVPTAVYEDPIETQKKIMRQTRELAIKRRQEEEAKEEAARKERIRIKLEAMGPPPEKKKKDTPKEEKPSPTQIQVRDEADVAPSQPESSASNDKPKATSDAIEPSSTNEPVAKASPEKTSVPAAESRVGDFRQGQTQSNAQQPQDGRTSQSWQNASTSSSDRFKPWAPAPNQQSTSRNVWGPPTSDRTLGNGTFNPELSRVPDMHQGPHPGPIGPPNSNRGNGQFQQGHGREYGSRPAPIGPPNKQQGTSREEQTRAAVANSGWGSLPDRIAQEDAKLAQEQDAELARRRELEGKGIAPEPGTVINDTWRPVNMNEDGTRGKALSKVGTVHDSLQSRKPEEDPTTRGMFEEQDMARRSVVGNHPQQFDAWRPTAMTQSPPVRGSRFFPNNRDVRLEEQPALFDRPGSPSPPPPTMAASGHPAYDGDIMHPHVLLPRPSPVVKLPPPPVLAPIGPPKPTSFAAAVQAPVVPVVNHNAAFAARPDSASRGSQYQDIRRQEPTAGNWQERINSLIGRNHSPTKSNALAVDSSSKSALEVSHQQNAATVSLPSLSSETAADDGTIESKPAAEECFEEQEMGSLPVIKVPDLAPALAWNPAQPPPKNLPRKFHVAQTTSAEAMSFPQQIANNISTVTIKVPGQEEPRSVNVSVAARQKSNPRRGGSRGNGPRQSHNRGRGRDASGGFASPSLDNASVSSSPNPGRGGRGGRGYGSSSWSRHVPTPVHT